MGIERNPFFMVLPTFASKPADAHGISCAFEGQFLDVFREAARQVFFLVFNPVVDAQPAGVVRFAFHCNPGSHAVNRKRVKPIRANSGMVKVWLKLRSG